MAHVLLYNINDPDKRMKVKLCLFRQGLRCTDVAPEAHGRPLGELLGLEGYGPGETEKPFTDEMLVMYDLEPRQFNALLDSLRQSRVAIALKAVVTETNTAWSSARLHRELAAEHAAMRVKRPSVHRKR